jgi:hypothetical protein
MQLNYDRNYFTNKTTRIFVIIDTYILGKRDENINWNDSL